MIGLDQNVRESEVNVIIGFTICFLYFIWLFLNSKSYYNNTCNQTHSLGSWGSCHTIIRFHTLYVNQCSAVAKETPSPSNSPAGEVQVNVKSFANHQLSLISARTGNTFFQVGWNWTNPLKKIMYLGKL